MTTVFLGGSRAVSKLNTAIRTQLQNLINKNCRILIGDANGADKAMQKYFADEGYDFVTVFCMGHARNNIGHWQTRTLSSERKNKDAEYFATKDRAMAREAKCGLMLWDGASRGTLKNICELLQSGKPAMVYFGPQKKFCKLTDIKDLRPLLSECDPRALASLQKIGANELPFAIG